MTDTTDTAASQPRRHRERRPGQGGLPPADAPRLAVHLLQGALGGAGVGGAVIWLHVLSRHFITVGSAVRRGG